MPVNVPTMDDFNALSNRVTALEQNKPPTKTPSPDGTTVTTVGPAIIDAKLRSFTLVTAPPPLVSPGIAIDGTYSANTQRVKQLYAKGGVCYQQNLDLNWYNMPDTTWQPCADPTGAPTGIYQISPNGIVDPTGKPFRANGINCLYRRVWGGMQVDLPRFSSANLKSAFPKINFVRFADLYSYGLDQASHPASDAAVRNWVTDLTGNGIVVYAEVHNTGNYAPPGSQQLTDDCNWLTEWANTFKSNPMVWYGCQNEPHGDAPGISRMMRTMYNAVRNTGATAPVGFCTGNPGAEIQQMDPAQFTDTTNTFFDPHYYGWNITSGVSYASLVAQCAAFHNRQGAMNSLCLEYGNSTDGTNVDGNWQQVCQQAANNPPGCAAWYSNWDTSGGDHLLANIDFSALTAYGAYVRDLMH